ncbi:inositol monophosphatase family protein [Oryzibacter oryziterrae]|uniref:inositol monophosphatase family protein n=1 Tax=Oryzibacter oryziterrae TaxID=2766474 RepID=UPI001F1FB4A5|nr:inositol monophosphatase [Oryzibacter oryziterrae]
MSVTRTELDRLFAMAGEAAEVEIMPRFANLSPADVKVKAHATDFVTVADEAAERLIERRAREAFGPDVFFLGEEIMERDPSLITRLAGAERAIVVDPIDGTFNYANGVPAFAVIIAVVEKGEVAAGLIYDPVRKDAACAIAGQGAFMQGGGRPEVALHVAAPAPLSDMHGCSSWAYAAEPLRSRLAAGLVKTWGASNYRCGGQEMRLLTSGAIHFCQYNKLSPWDHAAGWLIHKEAGGYSARLDGTPYQPHLRDGGILMTPDKASWDAMMAAVGS